MTGDLYELCHRTSHEVCLSIAGVMFIFHDYVSQREYDIGTRIWDAIKKTQGGNI